MKKRFVCAILACVFGLSNSTFATDWASVYNVASSDDPRTQLSIMFAGNKGYVDRDSVVRNGETIRFWWLQVWDTQGPGGIKKVLSKIEAKSPRLSRTLEVYGWDLEGKETKLPTMGDQEPFKEYGENTYKAQCIAAAVKYAKDGKDTGKRPKPLIGEK